MLSGFVLVKIGRISRFSLIMFTVIKYWLKYYEAYVI